MNALRELGWGGLKFDDVREVYEREGPCTEPVHPDFCNVTFCDACRKRTRYVEELERDKEVLLQAYQDALLEIEQVKGELRQQQTLLGWGCEEVPSEEQYDNMVAYQSGKGKGGKGGKGRGSGKGSNEETVQSAAPVLPGELQQLLDRLCTEVGTVSDSPVDEEYDPLGVEYDPLKSACESEDTVVSDAKRPKQEVEDSNGDLLEVWMSSLINECRTSCAAASSRDSKESSDFRRVCEHVARGIECHYIVEVKKHVESIKKKIGDNAGLFEVELISQFKWMQAAWDVLLLHFPRQKDKDGLLRKFKVAIDKWKFAITRKV
jgi:hypothetical protein